MTTSTIHFTPRSRPTVVSRAGRVPVSEGFTLESGAAPAEGRVAFEIAGPLDGPVVAVLGGISASRHVGAHPGDPRAGWWDALFGRDRPLDLCRYRILSIDYLAADRVTTADQAGALLEVLDALEVPSLHALVGASYGGAVGLSLAARCPERIGAVLAIGAAHEPHPMATALREIQRRIVRLAAASGRPRDGLALARALAMTTYRSEAELRDRFRADAPPVTAPVSSHRCASTLSGPFPVMDYLDRHGDSFAARFDGERFLRLSESLDLHRVDPRDVRAPVTLVSIDPDAIAPRWQMRALHERLPSSTLVEVDSIRGHDAFLTDTATFGGIVARFLDGVVGAIDDMPDTDAVEVAR